MTQTQELPAAIEASPAKAPGVYDGPPLALGQQIRDRRTELGIYNSEIARRFPLDASVTSLWERGRRLVPANRIAALAAALEWTVDDLIGPLMAAEQRARAEAEQAARELELVFAELEPEPDPEPEPVTEPELAEPDPVPVLRFPLSTQYTLCTGQHGAGPVESWGPRRGGLLHHHPATVLGPVVPLAGWS